MSRLRAPTRFADVVAAATTVFIASGGYKRAQVADIADQLGVAKGTVYLYAEGKEALFDLAVRHADGPLAVEPALLPVPSPAPGATAAYIAERIATRGRFPTLNRALTAPPDPDDAHEVLAELYDTLVANRTTIRLTNAAARDLPELGRLWFEGARSPLVARLTHWITQRRATGRFAPLPDDRVAARMLVESCFWFAVHRPFDPRLDHIPDDAVRATVITLLTRGLS